MGVEERLRDDVLAVVEALVEGLDEHRDCGNFGSRLESTLGLTSAMPLARSLHRWPVSLVGW